MNSLLNNDPDARPSCDEILDHEWLNKDCATGEEAREHLKK